LLEKNTDLTYGLILYLTLEVHVPFILQLHVYFLYLTLEVHVPFILQLHVYFLYLTLEVHVPFILQLHVYFLYLKNCGTSKMHFLGCNLFFTVKSRHYQSFVFDTIWQQKCVASWFSKTMSLLDDKKKV
jgi:hypothetical protein